MGIQNALNTKTQTLHGPLAPEPLPGPMALTLTLDPWPLDEMFAMLRIIIICNGAGFSNLSVASLLYKLCTTTCLRNSVDVILNFHNALPVG